MLYYYVFIKCLEYKQIVYVVGEKYVVKERQFRLILVINFQFPIWSIKCTFSCIFFFASRWFWSPNTVNKWYWKFHPVNHFCRKLTLFDPTILFPPHFFENIKYREKFRFHFEHSMTCFRPLDKVNTVEGQFLLLNQIPDN